MNKYTWSGGIDDTILDVNVVACRGSMSEQPVGLRIGREYGSLVDIVANERFMMVLKLNGVWVASLHPHEVR